MSRQDLEEKGKCPYKSFREFDRKLITITSKNKVFDNYRNEHFLFGANQDKFPVESIKNVENKINKKTS